MSDNTIIQSAADLLEVAAQCWLVGKRNAVVDSADAAALDVHRAQRRSRLQDLVGTAQRIHEVDAQIDLLRLTPNVPNRDHYIRKLEAVRRKLVAQRRR